MTFGRQKRLLLGWLAFLAPLPLPFNDVVRWPLLALYLAGVLFFLRRAAQDPPGWLPNWGMNVLGLLYVPFFFFDLYTFSGGRLVQAVLHLGLFTLVVKLYALVRERDKWQAALGIFFLFLAAMGTSVHPAIVLYLIAFLVLALLLLTRFAFLHVLAGFGREDPALAGLPLRGFLTLATVLTLLLAVPLFVLLPRVRSPYIVGRGVGTGTQIEASGFSDEVTLDSIGLIRNSREVALRLQTETPLDPDREIRFKAATYDAYQGGTWRRSPVSTVLHRSVGARFWLRKETPRRWATIYLQPLRTRSLPLPVDTVVVEPGVTSLDRDGGGALAFSVAPGQPVPQQLGRLLVAIGDGIFRQRRDHPLAGEHPAALHHRRRRHAVHPDAGRRQIRGEPLREIHHAGLRHRRRPVKTLVATPAGAVALCLLVGFMAMFAVIAWTVLVQSGPRRNQRMAAMPIREDAADDA